MTNQSKTLDSDLERSKTQNSVQRRSKKLIAYVLAFFAAGILCSTVVAPGRAVASLSPCSQMPGGLAMRGCEHPNYLCGIDPTSNLLSQGALSSLRSNDSLKNLLGVAFGAPAIDAAIEPAPPGAREWRKVPDSEPSKVSIRLFNSVLNL